ncbi:thymidine kinase, partial [Klebsiella quasipneumoniae]
KHYKEALEKGSLAVIQDKHSHNRHSV